MLPPRRHLLTALTALATAALLAGCGSGQSTTDSTGSTDSMSGSSTSSTVSVEATFATDGVAVTYDPALVPAGATAKVTGDTADSSSTVTLAVTGLLPNRTYGSHAHQKPCGAAPADSGAHFQHQADPVTPSVDPAYANPTNEVWLDFTTDAQGAASVTATQAEWAFTDDAAPQSVVIHAKPTATEPGKAGTAGDRAACVTVAF